MAHVASDHPGDCRHRSDRFHGQQHHPSPIYPTGTDHRLFSDRALANPLTHADAHLDAHPDEYPWPHLHANRYFHADTDTNTDTSNHAQRN